MGFEHPFPPTRVAFVPDRSRSAAGAPFCSPGGNMPDLLATSGDFLRIWKIESGGDDVHGNGMAVNMTRGPVRDFPADEKIHGFDTIGQTLVMSDFLLRLIISAAEESLLLATHTEPKPPTEPRTFMPPLRKGGATGSRGPG